jgi:hypothetical protein
MPEANATQTLNSMMDVFTVKSLKKCDKCHGCFALIDKSYRYDFADRQKKKHRPSLEPVAALEKLL